MHQKLNGLLLVSFLFIGCGEEHTLPQKQLVETNKTIIEKETIIETIPIKQKLISKTIEDNSMPTKSDKELTDEESDEVLEEENPETEEDTEITSEIIEESTIPTKNKKELEDEEKNKHQEDDSNKEEFIKNEKVQLELNPKSANEILDEERIEAEEE